LGRSATRKKKIATYYCDVFHSSQKVENVDHGFGQNAGNAQPTQDMYDLSFC